MLSKAVEIPRKTMVMFFLIDVSGSMRGDNIRQVNNAMREMIPELRDISDNNADAKIKMAVLSFSSGTEWVTTTPVEFQDYKWQDLTAADTKDANLGKACIELNFKLDNSAFLQDEEGNYAPIIVLISSGVPTDNYEKGIETLKQNKWFRAAIKIALGVDDARMDILEKFTGNVETAIHLNNISLLKRLLRFVSVTSSNIGSKKADTTSHIAASRQQRVARAIQDEVKEMKDICPDNSINEDW